MLHPLQALHVQLPKDRVEGVAQLLVLAAACRQLLHDAWMLLLVLWLVVLLLLSHILLVLLLV
jgi:hypothetical protein